MKKIIFILLGCLLSYCSHKPEKLPFLGNSIDSGNDTIYPKIQDFSFTDQDSTIITNKTFENKIYVADFIFLSCPTICPKMNAELSQVYTVFKDNPKVGFLSHTIDPERDSIKRLKEYTIGAGITKNWHFVTGNRDSIYSIASKSYYSTAYKDSKEPGGYVHSGGFLLVDKNRFIRGVYDGTNPLETKRLICDIKILLKE
ncbi:MAG: SCO family protein [Flavobacterium sp.]|uniref:SCO family protein n=1 Tax=Flavobacterium sp. TaxID=239 RepID=UPI002617D067|nr:SCO family protein [Flavobacterium sp.]MDD5149568.1 SCO family protein [Flavobacterium sp.]